MSTGGSIMVRRLVTAAAAGVLAVAGLSTAGPAAATPVTSVAAATTVQGWSTLPSTLSTGATVQILSNNARAMRMFRLDWRKPSQPWMLGTPTPAAAGVVKVLPPAVGTYQVRLVVPAVGTYAGYTSPERTVERLPAPGKYVALGDSYAAGEGLGPYRPETNVSAKGATFNPCHRSANDAYATKLLGGKYVVRPTVTGAARTFWACSGATVDTMTMLRADLAPTHGEFRKGEPNQLPIIPGHATSPVGPATRWISLSVGGNDAGFVPVVKSCVLAYVTLPTGKSAAVRVPNVAGCEKEIATRTASLPTVENSLYFAYRKLLDAAPSAKLVVVGYPRTLPDDVSRGTTLHIDAANRTAVGLPVSSTKLCVTNPSVKVQGSKVVLGVADVHVKALNEFEKRLNAAALQAAKRVAWDGYRSRIAFAETWSSSVAHNCTGNTANVSVNGVMFSQALRGMDDLKALSTASFHPTKVGAQRIGARVEAAFSTNWDPGAAPPKLSGAILASGNYHTCRLDTAGKAWCWGRLTAAWRGNQGSSDDRGSPTLVAGGQMFTALTATGHGTCGIGTDKYARCWGISWPGQQDARYQTTPVNVSSGHPFTALSANQPTPYTSQASTACGIDTTRSTWCWGSNTSSEFGAGNSFTQTYSNVPVRVAGAHSFLDVSVGITHVCAVDAGRKAWCWGNNYRGQLGDDLPTASDVPMPVTGNHYFTTVTAGHGSTCGIDTTKKAWCWGGNYYGEFGNGTTSYTGHPTEVSGGHQFSTIRMTNGYVCALDGAGKAWCWGYAMYGQLGDGDTSTHSRLTPNAVVGGHTFTALSVGTETACAVDTGGKTWCWGDGNRGQLGDGDLSNHWTATPRLVTGV